MDYNLQNQSTKQPAPKRGFAIASMICGILSLVLCCPGVGLPLGALAILFAVLTRSKKQSMDSMTITGIITGSIGLFVSIVITISLIYSFSLPSFQSEIYDTWEEIYDEETADMLADFYGFDL